jgi:hypothetical protein
MIVFISWSGGASRMMAEGLRSFLELALARCTPWVSSVDIEAGTKWTEELRAKIKSAGYCVVCVTSENVTKPWINYEVGAIREGFEKRTSPWLLDIKPEQLEKLPLSSVQGTSTSKEDTYKLICEINKILPDPHPGTAIEEQFKVHWNRLEKSLNDAKTIISASPVLQKRDPADALDELVLNTRQILDRLPNPTLDFLTAALATRPMGRGMGVDEYVKANADGNVAAWIRELLNNSPPEGVSLDEVTDFCGGRAYEEKYSGYDPLCILPTVKAFKDLRFDPDTRFVRYRR